MSVDVDTLFPWVGNKKFYIDFIKRHLPEAWDKKTYIEPFFGTGVVFQQLKPRRAILSDASPHLMGIFACMKSNPKYFYTKLTELFQNNSATLHEKCKTTIFDIKSDYQRSAMFWFLLRTSLYSFVCLKKDNKSFTCCYKSTGKPLLFKKDLYFDMAKTLNENKDIQVFHSDFGSIFDMAKKGDFIFVDPPYMNKDRPSRKIYTSFSYQDHERLVQKVLDADKRGCYIMMFNHKHPYLTDKLSHFQMIPVDHSTMRKRRSQFVDYDEVLYLNWRSSR